MTAKEVLNGLEFGSWSSFKNFIIGKLEEKYGIRSSINNVVSINGIENQLNYYVKEQLLSYLIVYKGNLIILSSPDKSAIRVAKIRLEGDISQVKEYLSSRNIYAGLANIFNVISDAYNKYALLESLLSLEENHDN